MLGFGRSATLGIGLAVHLKDHFSRKADRIEDEMKEFTHRTSRLIKKNAQVMMGLGVITTVAGGAMAAGLAAGSVASANLEHSLALLQARTGGAKQGIGELRNEIRSLANDSIFFRFTIGQAARELAGSGFSREQIKDVIKPAVDMATALNGELVGKQGTANILRNLSTSFDIPAKNSRRMANVVTKAVSDSNTSLKDFQKGMQDASVAAKNMNISFKETAAIVATLQNAGISTNKFKDLIEFIGTEVGRLQYPGVESKLSQLGIGLGQLTNQKGELKSMSHILEVFRLRLRHLHQVGKLTTLEDVMGDDVWSIMSLLGKRDMGKGFIDMLNSILNSRGTMQRIKNILSGSTYNQFWKMLSNLIGVFEVLGKTLEPLIMFLIKSFKVLFSVMASFFKTGFGKFMTYIIAGFSGLLITTGIFIVSLGLIAKLLSSSMIGLRQFAKTAIWAYNSATASAYRYAAAARAGTIAPLGYNKVGSIYVTGGAKKGRMVQTAQQVGKYGAWGSIGGAFSNLILMFRNAGSKIVGLFRKLAGGILRVFRFMGFWGTLIAIGITLLGDWNKAVKRATENIRMLLNMFSLDGEAWKKFGNKNIIGRGYTWATGEKPFDVREGSRNIAQKTVSLEQFRKNPDKYSSGEYYMDYDELKGQISEDQDININLNGDILTKKNKKEAEEEGINQFFGK